MEINLNGHVYELPKRVPKVAKLFDDFNKAFSSESDTAIHYKAMAVLEGTIGRDAIKELFGTTDKEQISVVDSAMTVKEIDDAYMAPLTEYSRRKEAEALDTPAYAAVSELLANMSNLPPSLK